MTRYVKIVCSDDGGTRFEEVDVPQDAAPFAENVPPLLVSGPTPVTSVRFVTTPEDLQQMQPHPTPRRQFAVVLDGEMEVETSDGEKRTLGPGTIVLLEDLDGRGHVTRVLRGPATFLTIPLAD